LITHNPYNFIFSLLSGKISAHDLGRERRVLAGQNFRADSVLNVLVCAVLRLDLFQQLTRPPDRAPQAIGAVTS
jgi:hypothetical protein